MDLRPLHAILRQDQQHDLFAEVGLLLFHVSGFSLSPSPLPSVLVGGANCSFMGRSRRLLRPRSCRNFFVVPYSTGRPSESCRPAMRTRPRSMSCRKTSLHCTPRIASTSVRMIG